MKATEGQDEKCELIGIWEVLGRRWSLLILKNLSTKEVIRFNEGLISKKIYPEIPPKVEYRLTTRAKELEVIIKELAKWASRWKTPELQKSAPSNLPVTQ
jgi:DNA-binding HxlR family transcriptional regulator